MVDTPPDAGKSQLLERFERMVDRSGEHHLWTGAKNPSRGTGRIKVAGRQATAHRVAWELTNGPLPETVKVYPCVDEPLCVRVEHLRAEGAGSRKPEAKKHARGARGAGSKRQIKPGVWKLTVIHGKYDDGSMRRVYKTVNAANPSEASTQLLAFVADVQAGIAVPTKNLRDITIDDAMELFLANHLAEEKGRENKTVSDYRNLHSKWFSPYIGQRKVRNVDEAMLDTIFGRMRRQGLSRSRMNQAKSLYGPFFRWARSRKIIGRSPMIDFQLPTSNQVSKERMPPEVEELTLMLNTSLNIVPDITPVLVLAAVTGMRRGELVGLRRSRIIWDQMRLTVDTAIGNQRNVKHTKTRKERSFYVDEATIAMLKRHCEEMDEQAALFGLSIANDGYVFSLDPDCEHAMPPDHVTKRVGELKDYLGIANKQPATAALEDQALALRRQPSPPRDGRPGPAPTSGLSFVDIGKALGRSERWAAMAVRSAERREKAIKRGANLDFDGSILALRKFTSSELLDAGFNVSLVAHRQGHGPQVLVKHYAKGRKSADRKAAEHLGRVVHDQAKHG